MALRNLAEHDANKNFEGSYMFLLEMPRNHHEIIMRPAWETPLALVGHPQVRKGSAMQRGPRTLAGDDVAVNHRLGILGHVGSGHAPQWQGTNHDPQSSSNIHGNRPQDRRTTSVCVSFWSFIVVGQRSTMQKHNQTQNVKCASMT